MKKALAIRHVSYEDLGSWEGILAGSGYEVNYRDAGLDDLTAVSPLAPDLLIILGGPIGMHQMSEYPYLATEVGIARRRIGADLPMLGICLGSQIMAHALGADVSVAERDEIGWAPVELTPAGRDSPLAHLDSIPVLHWHGDRFDLPKGARRLAATPLCPNQAFCCSSNLLAMQFHPEVNWPHFERWLIGHAHTIHERGESVTHLRMESERNCRLLEPAAGHLLKDWLSELR